MDNKDKTIIIKLPPELKGAFDDACRANDINMSQCIRALIKSYVAKHQSTKTGEAK